MKKMPKVNGHKSENIPFLPLIDKAYKLLVNNQSTDFIGWHIPTQNDNIMQKNSSKCASHRLHLRKKFLSGPKKSMTILPKRNAFSFSPWQGQVLFCLHVVEKAFSMNPQQGKLNSILYFNFDNFDVRFVYFWDSVLWRLQ